jgi:outer membrane protein assembly factor BamB
MDGDRPEVRAREAEILREYGPFRASEHVHGVTCDGTCLWYAAGDRLQSVELEQGLPGAHLAVGATAGTAFDGKHLYQIAGDRIQKIDPKTGKVLETIPTPGPAGDSSGLTWAEGSLWVGQFRDRSIVQIDPATGRVLKRIRSTRFVTGVTFVDGELWHATWEDEAGGLSRVDPTTGEVLERLEMPKGTFVTGLESDGGDLLLCGGGRSGKIRVIRRPRRS